MGLQLDMDASIERAGSPYCSLGSFAWEMSFRIFRLETFVCVPSLGNFRLDLSLGSVRLGSFALKRSLGIFRFGSFVWELSLGIFRLILSIIFRLVWDFRLEAFAWDLSLGNFCLGSSGLGNWSPEAGGTGWLTLGETGGDRLP